MKDLAELALDTACTRGASYADVRLIDTRYQSVRTRNGRINVINEIEDLGFGVQVIADGAWGFAGSGEVTKEKVEEVSALAVQIAKASARHKMRDVELAPVAAYEDTYQTPIRRDPFEVSLDEKIDFLLNIDGILRRVNGVRVATGAMDFRREHQFFASTVGSRIEQTIYISGVGYSAMAAQGNEVQMRSYPTEGDTRWDDRGGSELSQTGGYELIEDLPLEENAQRIGEEAVALLSADPCPSEMRDVILEGSILQMQIHESTGHPLELDRVLGTEADFAGTSFLTLDKLGKFRYASDAVTIYLDSTAPGGLGTTGYDDEGVPAQRADLIRNGIVVGYMTSRETARAIGQEASNGCARADSWGRLPMVRMSNVNLQPGEWTLDDLIADTDDGIYMETRREWSIDQQRLNFWTGAQIAWEIKHGKRGRMLKNPSFEGKTVDFWNSCDAVCNKDHWFLWGVTKCGKAIPHQKAEVSHGTAPSRFRNVKVGGSHA